MGGRAPFLTMVVFTVVFGHLAKLPSVGGAPYPVMVFAGMLPWFLFSTILSEASNSLIGNTNLISKVYFPRIIIPASSAVVALVDFAINLVLLIGLMLWYGYAPGWQHRVSAAVSRSCGAREPRPRFSNHRTQRQVS